MKTYWRMVVLTAIFIFIGGGACNIWAKDDDWGEDGYGHRETDHRVLHIQHTATTSQTEFPQYMFMYHQGRFGRHASLGASLF